MKKTLTVLLLSLLVLSGCKGNVDIKIGDSITAIYEQEMPFVFLGSLAVYKTDGMYTTIVAENGTVQKIVEFSSSRECCTAQGVSLIKNGNIEQYLGVGLSQLKKELGEVHADVGSGVSIPTYIAEKGYLICFYAENDTIWAIEKIDILTGERAEYVDGSLVLKQH